MSTHAYYSEYWTEQGFNPTGALPGDLGRLYNQHIVETDVVLDVGCGDGRTSGPWMLEHARSYTGADISQPALDAARSLGLDTVLIEDAGALPFPDASFDVVLSVEVYEHLFAPQEAAVEAFRVLRPGGRLICTVPHIAHWKQRADLALRGRWDPKGDEQGITAPWRDPHIRFYTAPALRALLLEAGFSDVEVAGRRGSVAQNFRATARYARTSHTQAWSRLLARFPSLGAGLVAVATR